MISKTCGGNVLGGRGEDLPLAKTQSTVFSLERSRSGFIVFPNTSQEKYFIFGVCFTGRISWESV
ncbi:MAG: hypothetical protein IJU40_07570 [Desulfovibrionaceae bacterium]|nr:hypothetical protein [Desulfovibrionaceae bacterium]